jgi:hypothetical protein
MEFTNVARVNGGTFLLPGAKVIDKALQNVSMELWLFDSQITPPADSAAWSISDADMGHVIAIIPFTSYYASALNSVSLGVNSFTGPYKCAAGTTSVWGCAVLRGAPVVGFATLDLTFKLHSLQN